ncbi:MAG: aspartate kinase [Clostridiales bacterium]|nr:aspartate kinase [Clostridiales bacterium]
MSLIVQKFGGSSVADKERLFNVAAIIADAYREGNRIVAVVSAQGDTTDDLLAKAAEITSSPSLRETDMLLSTGEQISASLLALAIGTMKLPVVSLNAWQVGIHSDSNYSNAKIKKIDTERILRELDSGKIVIVTGFQGINRFDDVTTLGRGGSDTTAVALASVLKADKCQIYTDVDGVYTADPRKVPTAKKLKEISYDEMLELASLGAQVLHNRSVEMAKKYHVELEVLSSFDRIGGTIVREDVKVEKMLVTGVAKDTRVARISVIGLEDVPGVAFKLFSLMGQKNIVVDIILQSIGRNGTKDISFTVSEEQLDQAVAVLEEVYGKGKVSVEKDVAKVSVVGAGMETNAGVAAKMFEALYSVGANIHMISTSEIKISVLIDRKDADKAVSAIHDAFIG